MGLKLTKLQFYFESMHTKFHNSKKKAPEYKLRSQEIISKILHPYATQGNGCLA